MILSQQLFIVRSGVADPMWTQFCAQRGALWIVKLLESMSCELRHATPSTLSMFESRPLRHLLI
jgi:hypothetical protein